jgi:hypothetical protein
MRSTAHFLTTISTIVLIAAFDYALTTTPVSALNVATPASVGIKAADQMFGNRIEVRRGGGGGGRHMGGGGGRHAGGGMAYHRGGAAVGPRGGAAYRRTAVRGPRGNVAVRTTAVAGRRGGWARPGWYGWPRGGAIAAGAAIGFVTAATAAAWAGAPPAAGMCWYYTDPSRTQGFWDYCQ